MAVVETGKATKMILKVATGTSSSGQTIYSNRTISNVSPNVASATIFSIGTSLAALQSHALGSIARQDTAILVED